MLGRAVVAGLASVAVAGLASLAFGAASWWVEAPLAVQVHEHAFHRVTANGIGCAMRVRLYFDAPYAGYREAAAGRNHYRFRAELKLAGGTRVTSEVFDNTEAGARVFAFSHDSQSQACWADRQQALRRVDVHACRGQRCTPEDFE